MALSLLQKRAIDYKQKKKDAAASEKKKIAVASATRKKGKPSGAALFQSLAGGRAPKKSSGKKRPKLEVTKKVEQMVVDFTTVKALKEFVDAREKEEKSELRDGLDQAYRDLMWTKRSQPENPKIPVRNSDGQPDCNLMYTIIAKFSPQFGSPGEDEDALEAAIDFLSNDETHGHFDEEQARIFVETELEFTPRCYLPLTDWWTQDDNATLHTAAEKLLQFVTGQKVKMTAEELAELQEAVQETFKYTPLMKYPKDILGRLCDYCESQEQFDFLWQCLTPQVQLRQAKFGESDSAKDRGQRLDHLAAEIIGEGLGVDLLADDED